jgi:hypothetical protein
MRIGPERASEEEEVEAEVEPEEEEEAEGEAEADSADLRKIRIQISAVPSQLFSLTLRMTIQREASTREVEEASPSPANPAGLDWAATPRRTWSR